MKLVLPLWLALLGPLAWGGDINPQRAQFNYQMSCQGCHTPDGSGANAVPQLRDVVGIFLSTQAGREYLVRVPGSAVSALNDANLAEVLNWIIQEFAGASVTLPFEPFTPQEVGRLRQHPLTEVVQYRAQLLADIASAKQRE